MNSQGEVSNDKKNLEKVKNANMARTAAEYAQMSGHPVASSIGKGIKIADKITHGKSSEKIGKKLSKNPALNGGNFGIPKALQNRLNTSMNSNINSNGSKKSNANISEKLKRKNNFPTKIGRAINMLNKSKAGLEKVFGDKSSKIEEENELSGVNLKINKKTLMIAGITLASLMFFIMFGILCSLLNAGYTELIQIAKTLKLDEVIEKINKNKQTSYNYEEDIFILNNYNDDSLHQVKKITDYTLEEAFPEIKYYSEKYTDNKKNIYNYFYKLYYIKEYYKNNYNVNLNVALIHLTLIEKNEDKREIFLQNTKGFDLSLKENNPLFDYNYDWYGIGYKTSIDESSHDIELLAQHQISESYRETCTDSNMNVVNSNEDSSKTITCNEGETYNKVSIGYKIDLNKYKEFLKQYFEEKYYINKAGNSGNINNPNDSSNLDTPSINTDWQNWRQCNESWSDSIIGNTSYTMCTSGCLITSVSIQIARSGTQTIVTPFTPAEGLKYFSINKKTAEFRWNVTAVAPYFIKAFDMPLTGMTKKQIADKLSKYSNYYIIIYSKNYRNRDHFMAVNYVDTNTSDIYVFDPAKLVKNNESVYGGSGGYYPLKAYFFEKKD